MVWPLIPAAGTTPLHRLRGPAPAAEGARPGSRSANTERVRLRGKARRRGWGRGTARGRLRAPVERRTGERRGSTTLGRVPDQPPVTESVPEQIRVRQGKRAALLAA